MTIGETNYSLLEYSNLTGRNITGRELVSYKDLGLIEIVHCLLGVPLNLIVLHFARRACQHHESRHQILVISMATADLLLTTFHSSYTFIRYGLSIKPTPHLTIFTYVVTYVCSISSSLSLLLLNIDKFVFVFRPLRYEIIVTRPRLAKSVCIAWLTASIWTAIMLYGPWTEFNWKEANYVPTHIEAYIVFTNLFFTLPNVVSFGISSYIVCVVAKHQKAIAKHTSAGSSFDNVNDFANRHRIFIPFKSILFVFSATTWCVMTTIPYRLGFILIYLMITNDTRAVFGLFVLMGFNAVGNPVITLFTHKIYRRRLRRLLNLSDKDHTYSATKEYSVVVRCREPSIDGAATPHTVH